MFTAVPLGWLQLKAQKLRLVAAVTGIAFAVILIFVQLEFREALFVSAVRYHTAMDYDLAMLSPKTDFMVSSKQFPRGRLYQVLGFDGVESVTAVYMRLVSWRNPADPSNARNILAIGFNPSEPGFSRLLSAEQREAIKIPDQVIFDRRGRDEYGPVREMLDAGQRVSAEINDRRVAIAGMYQVGTSFGLDGIAGMYQVGTSFGLDGGIITSDLNFLRILPTRKKSAIDLGLIKLEPGQDAAEVQARIREAIPMDVRVLTRQEFKDVEVRYWNKTTPIGYIFAFGAVMGLIVGLIIVYQILFSDVQDHLKEYATLKAMGYTHGYLRNVVLQEAIILAVLGFIPGMGIAHLVFTKGADATRLPLEMSLESAGGVFILTLAMCAGSGLMALRKLRAVDPAEVF
jgi:putative ABC transport system permease protein